MENQGQKTQSGNSKACENPKCIQGISIKGIADFRPPISYKSENVGDTAVSA
jgi:hypothetical protein